MHVVCGGGGDGGGGIWKIVVCVMVVEVVLGRNGV